VSCGPARRTFRLLDGYVGWEALAFQNLEGQGEGEELQLARITAGAIGCQEPLPWLPPGRLARGCGACDWVLAAAAPESRLLRRSCTGDWEPVPGPLGERGVLAGDALVAARRSRIAVADPACGRVWLLAAGGAQVLAVLAAGDVTAIALTAWRECVMAVAGEPRLRRCDREGGPLVSFGPALPPGRVIRIGSGRDCALWILVERDGACLLYRAGRDSRSWRPETLAVLAADLPRTTLAIAADAGFCFEERGDSGLP